MEWKVFQVFCVRQDDGVDEFGEWRQDYYVKIPLLITDDPDEAGKFAEHYATNGVWSVEE
jgi:hypothetical protein